MRQKRSFYCAAVLLMFSVGLVSGCSTKRPEAEVAAATPGVESLESLPRDTGAEEPGDYRSTRGMYSVLFDFDRSEIRADQVETIEKNADFLKANPDKNIRIEGNCDERGTNEYNLALGERRAQSAKKYLVNLGIEASRLSTLSLGEEKPYAHGSDENAWSQNRRDDFVVAE